MSFYKMQLYSLLETFKAIAKLPDSKTESKSRELLLSSGSLIGL